MRYHSHTPKHQQNSENWCSSARTARLFDGDANTGCACSSEFKLISQLTRVASAGKTIVLPLELESLLWQICACCTVYLHCTIYNKNDHRSGSARPVGCQRYSCHSVLQILLLVMQTLVTVLRHPLTTMTSRSVHIVERAPFIVMASQVIPRVRHLASSDNSSAHLPKLRCLQ